MRWPTRQTIGERLNRMGYRLKNTQDQARKKDAANRLPFSPMSSEQIAQPMTSDAMTVHTDLKNDGYRSIVG